MRAEILRIHQLCWSNGYYNVLENLSMYLYEGEIAGIVGLHDSGKSLLLKIMAEAEKPSSGIFFLNEERVDSFGKSVYLVSPEIELIENLTVSDNIFIIRKHERRKLLLNVKAMSKLLGVHFEQFGVNIAPGAKVASLSETDKQIVAIMKGFILGAKVILIDDILDKDIAGSEAISGIIKKLSEKRVSFIVTGRHFENLQNYCERIMFLSGGAIIKTVKNVHRKQIDADKILLGKMPHYEASAARREQGRIAFKAIEVSGEIIHNISFEIHKGEIAAVYDVYRKSGNELISLMKTPGLLSSGCFEKPREHKIFFSDFDLKNAIIEFMPLKDNLCLQSYKKLSFAGFIRRNLVQYAVNDFVSGHDVNNKKENCFGFTERQKMSVYLYRLKLLRPDLLVCVYPELVPDAVNYMMIEETLKTISEMGTAICIFCSNLDKVNRFADKFVIFDKGNLHGIFTRDDLFLK